MVWKDIKKELIDRIKIYCFYLGSAIINAVYLCFWVAIQFGAAKIIDLIITRINIDDSFCTSTLFLLKIIIAVGTFYQIIKNVQKHIQKINNIEK